MDDTSCRPQLLMLAPWRVLRGMGAPREGRGLSDPSSALLPSFCLQEAEIMPLIDLFQLF